MNNVQKLRRLHKMTQNEVSDIIKYPKPLYAAFEKEKYILPLDKLKSLANLFNVTTDYLIRDMSDEIKNRYK